MHRAFEDILSSSNWQSLRQEVETLRNEVETLCREAATGGLDVTRLQNAGHLSHSVGLAILALQQQEMERLRQERDSLKKEYIERARQDLRFQDLDLAQLQASSAGPVEVLE
jgi:hypothetical protein